jgi:nicotinate-nucleotide pyrophosphorylase (carboxylating)
MIMYLQKEIERLIDISISEDIGDGDITTETLVNNDVTASGTFVIKQAGVVAALPFLEVVFKKIDPRIKVSMLVQEGSFQKAGTDIAKVTGPARGVLTGERVALNLIQHASGVATITHEYVRKLKGLKCVILDTRKTLPGLRALEKYAVKIGGGTNHRFSLNDRFIIKGNHLYFQGGKSSASIIEAVKKAKAARPDLDIEVEISNTKHLSQALESEAKAIMLSRMMPVDIKKCVELIRKTNKKVFVESLGTITLDTIRAYAETGVDGISIGSITHSVPSLDIVMLLT